MASIRTQIELYDRISSPLMNITSALNMTINAFEEMDAAANSSFDSSTFDGAREHINAANAELNQMVDNINRTQQHQEQFNESMDEGTKAATGLEKKLLGIAATYASIQGVESLLNLSDTMTLNESRLSLIVDDGGSVEELQNKIYASAQNARAAYTDVSSTIAKLGMMAGDAFANNDEMIAFAELMNKNFVVGGASATEQASAMYQLTQAMASGKLQGDEYRSIIENAPLLAKSIEDYMTNVQHAQGSMKDWAADGLLTADVIKNAMFNASDQVNQQFEQMPMTFGQVATSIKNQALVAFDPVLDKLNDIANSDRFNSMATGITTAFVVASGVAVGALDMITQAGGFLADNWSIIAPLIYGVIAALGIYTGYMMVSNAVQLISTGIQTAHAIAIAVKTGATIADAAATNNLTVAQWALNSALLASPITWVIIAVIALIAVFYGVIAAVNKFAGTSISATGVIMGVFATAGAFIGNVFMGLLQIVFAIVEYWYNLFASFANFFGNLFNDPIGAIINLFGDLADNVLGVLQKIAEAMDFIFGSSMADTVQGWRADLQVMAETAVKEYGNGKYEDKVAELDINGVLDELGLSMERFNYSDAYGAGYSFGEGIDEKISDFNPADLFGGSKIPDPSDYANSYDTTAMQSNIGDIADNTGSIKDSVNMTQEDLKYLRDEAERDVINRYTTAEIKVDMSGMQNNINNTMDLDGVVSYLGEGVNEAMERAAEGVHS